LVYLKKLADRGSYLGMDRFGLDRGKYSSFETRVAIVAKLCADGYADQMVLSHDASCWDDWIPPEMTRGTDLEMPNWKYTHIPQDVVPALKRHGVTDAQVNQMLIENPRAILPRR
jgi:phosphotriesterase-related protein